MKKNSEPYGSHPTRLFIAFLILNFFLPEGGNAQEFSIKQIELGNDQVTMHYDLIDTARDHTYSIYVYSSKDNFLSPLEKLSGDVGLEVRPGTNKKIVWKAREEFGPFVGDLELEVRGRVYVPFIRFEGFTDVEVRKRGVPFIAKWSGGTRQNILNFQLYNGETLAYTFPNVPNTTEYKITIPTSIKPGKGYHFRISDIRNRDQVVETSQFEIRRRFPTALKLCPVLAVAGAVYLLLPDPGSEILDGPPDVPGQKN